MTKAKTPDLMALAQEEALAQRSSNSWWSTLPPEVVDQVCEIREKGITMDDGRVEKASPKLIARILKKAGFADASDSRVDTLLRAKGLK